MFIVRSFLSFNAVVIILLHSTIPHRHHIEMTYAEDDFAHQGADNVIEYLSLAFHQNYTNNIEHYVLQKLKSFRGFYFADLNSFSKVSFSKAQWFNLRSCLYFRIQSNWTQKGFVLISNGLRAPPNW